jgi:hypothetical protein
MLGVRASVECVVSSRRALVPSAGKRLVRSHGHGSATRLQRVPHPSRASCDRVGNLTFSRGLGSILLLVLFVGTVASARTEPTVEELKARVSSASVGDKAKICLEIAEKQLNAADKLYTADDMEKAQASLTDVVAFSELARDYSIQSHKHQKQTEIAIRSMTRKLNDLAHVVSREEQGPLKDAIQHLERVRDDLLAAMFPKGAK